MLAAASEAATSPLPSNLPIDSARTPSQSARWRGVTQPMWSAVNALKQIGTSCSRIQGSRRASVAHENCSLSAAPMSVPVEKRAGSSEQAAQNSAGADILLPVACDDESLSSDLVGRQLADSSGQKRTYSSSAIGTEHVSADLSAVQTTDMTTRRSFQHGSTATSRSRQSNGDHDRCVTTVEWVSEHPGPGAAMLPPTSS